VAGALGGDAVGGDAGGIDRAMVGHGIAVAPGADAVRVVAPGTDRAEGVVDHGVAVVRRPDADRFGAGCLHQAAVVGGLAAEHQPDAVAEVATGADGATAILDRGHRVEAVGIDRVRGHPQGGDGPGVEDEAAAAVELDAGGARAVHGDAAGIVDGAVAVHRDALAGVAVAGDGGAGVRLDAVVVADHLDALGTVDPARGRVERAGAVVGAVGGERALDLDHVAVAGHRDRVGIVTVGHDAGAAGHGDVARHAGVGPVAFDAEAVGTESVRVDRAEQRHQPVAATGVDAMCLGAVGHDRAAALHRSTGPQFQHQSAGLVAIGRDGAEVQEAPVVTGDVEAVAPGPRGADVPLAG